MIANYSANKNFAKSERTHAHDSCIAEINKAKRSTILHLPSLNISKIIAEIYALDKLTFLDLAYNNITLISQDIGKLKELTFLWLNNNPLKAIPTEIANCKLLKEIDIRETEVSSLPREMAELKSLVSLKLDGCPMKSSLQATIVGTTLQGDQMLGLTLTLQRKHDRREYKAKLCNKLIEWKYPSANRTLVESKVEELFEKLKDVNSAGLKRLVRQFLRLFPKNFEEINIEEIRSNLTQLENDEIDREKISQIILMLRANFPKEKLVNIVRIAKDLYNNTDDSSIKEMLKYRKYVFIGKFEDLSYAVLLDNIQKYKKGKIEEKAKAVRSLKKKISKLYKDDKIEEALIDSMVSQLIGILKKVNVIEGFTVKAKTYLPKGVEIATFNATNICNAYFKECESQAEK